MILVLFALILLFPFLIILPVLIKTTSKGRTIFKQKRVGLNGKVFTLFKFRTMKEGSEKKLATLSHLNEADGPVFKIGNDPRYTKIGNILAKTGIDEIPQFVNILKGDMSLVGPRPLPIYEANKLTPYQKRRESVLPGITSSWVIEGSHNLSFKKWMELDLSYVQNASLKEDLIILVKTLKLILKELYKSAV